MTGSTASPPTVACPQCGTRHVWSTANAFRPFCSERCKLIDLGAWANESYRVPVNASLGESTDFPEDDPLR